VHVNLVRKTARLVEDNIAATTREVLEDEGKGVGEISITFDGDDCLRRLNKKYLGRDRPTDVIAFDLSGEKRCLIGDIYISVDRAADQARENQVSVGEELLRLQVHALLHLAGYDHTGADDVMWQKQECWVNRLSERAGK